jgi:hypothetical protein
VERVQIQLPESLVQLERSLRHDGFQVVDVHYEGLAFGSCYLTLHRGRLRIRFTYDGRDDWWSIHVRDEHWAAEPVPGTPMTMERWKPLLTIRTALEGAEPASDDAVASREAEWLAEHVDEVFAVLDERPDLSE